MTTYNTYAECKKNHPEKEVVTTGSKWIGDYEHIGKFEPLSAYGDESHVIGDEGWIICNPADYLMSLEEFFEAGHKFVDGDCYINEHGFVDIVGKEYDIEYANTRAKIDSECFVLSAKALEEKVEQVEWEVFHGESWYPCIRLGIDIYGNHAYQIADGEFEGEFNGNPDELCFRKPETPEQKEEREELEAAYDLYVYTKESSIYSCSILSFDKFVSDSFNKEREEYINIVKKTGYRKPE